MCFPHAGTGASVFHGWAAPLAESGIEVRAAQYPGRESRWGEPLITSVQEMADHWLGHWLTLGGDDDVPVVIYGHSMGVLVAYELARRMQAQASPRGPQRLIFGGRNAPHVPSKHPPIHHLSDERFLAKVSERYGNLPKVLLEDAEMRQLVVPILKADFQLVDDYILSKPVSPPLVVPLTILEGTEDPFTSDEALAGWIGYTAATCDRRSITGGHFFHQQERDRTLDLIREILMHER